MAQATEKSFQKANYGLRFGREAEHQRQFFVSLKCSLGPCAAENQRSL